MTKKLTKELNFGKAETNTIGGRIKQLRGKEPRKSFCDKVGIAINTLINYENNTRVPDAKLVARICTIYGIATDWLILGSVIQECNNVDIQTESAMNMDRQNLESYKKRSFGNSNKEGWAFGLALSEFETLWDEYRSEQEARRGWLQVEVIKRFPEFIEWLEQRQAPLKPAQIASLKKGGQTFHYGLPDQLDDD